MSKLTRWLPFLNWPRPTPALLRGEAAAALTVAVVMIPQSVAYAGLAGMPLVAGLYATFLPALVSVLFSGSTRLSVGPSALTSVLVGTSLVGLAAPASDQWISLVVWLALMSGAVQLALGAGGGAWALNLVSSPVLTGFSQAAALLIIASQIPTLIGAQGSILEVLRSPRVDDPVAMAFGVTGVALLVLGKRFAPRLPMVLIMVAGAALISQFSGYSAHGAVIGALPVGLPSPYWPGWPGWETLGSLVAPALVIALVSSLETASSAKIESQRDAKRWNANQDLIGQGLGKLASAFSGSFPTSTSFSRSAITLYAGARTGWATVIATMFVLALLFVTPVLHHVPRAALAAVVVAAVAGLVKPRELARLWRIDRVETVTAGMTFAVTILTAPRIYWGVLTGVLMGLAHFLYLRLHPRIIEAGLHPDGSMRDRNLWQLPPLAPQLYALRMDDELDFASASAFERAIIEHLAAHPEVRHVCLFAQPINRIDTTGVEVFTQLRAMLEGRGIALHISGIKLPVERVLRRAGALAESPLLHMYRTDAEALVALQRIGG